MVGVIYYRYYNNKTHISNNIRRGLAYDDARLRGASLQINEKKKQQKRTSRETINSLEL